jgi:hypothetical protein
MERGRVEDAGNPDIVLSVLTSIERDCAITQRKLARELGIALGLTKCIFAAVRAKGPG